MSGTGKVQCVYGANVPDTDEPARKVVVTTTTGTELAFFIPEGNDPPAGVEINWGPRHCWWNGQKVRKLSWEMKP